MGAPLTANTNGSGVALGRRKNMSHLETLKKDDDHSGGVKPIAITKIIPGNASHAETFEVKNLPVQEPSTDHNEHALNSGNAHLKRDIRDIGAKLNNINNDLYHVLFELVNSQSEGVGTMWHNMHARDYNAALPGRDWRIKPLKAPSTGDLIATFFYEKNNVNGTPITIEDLEDLSNPEKEEILLRLGMAKDFNLILEQISVESSLPQIRSRMSTRQRTILVSIEDGEENEDGAGKGDQDAQLTNDKEIETYMTTLTPAQAFDFAEMYDIYLTMQVRVAVGLPRDYCANI